MEQYESDTSTNQKQEDWMTSKWRPMMGWMYMLVCTMDFVVFPILWSLVQAMTHGNVATQWNPVTLQGAGLFHMAMGAVIGVAAFGRTQEKLAIANNTPAPVVSAPVAPTAPSFSAPAPSFGSKPTGPAPFVPPAL